MRPEHEHDLIERVAWTIAAGTDNTSADDWQQQGEEYRVEMREGAQAVLTLLRTEGWAPPTPQGELVTIELDQETYDMLMRLCAERDLSPGQVINEALIALAAELKARKEPTRHLDEETFRQYNLPAMERRITALEEQVGTPPPAS